MHIAYFRYTYVVHIARNRILFQFQILILINIPAKDSLCLLVDHCGSAVLWVAVKENEESGIIDWLPDDWKKFICGTLEPTTVTIFLHPIKIHWKPFPNCWVWMNSVSSFRIWIGNRVAYYGMSFMEKSFLNSWTRFHISSIHVTSATRWFT